jgi:hypothetical protein
MCKTEEVPPLVVLVFIDLFDYMTLRLASIVFFENVHAGMFPALSVFKGMNTVAPPLFYNYVE